AAGAHHRQSPPVIALTTSGDARLPRLTAPGDKTLALATPAGSGHDVVGIAPFRKQDQVRTIFAGGDNANVSVSSRGTTFAWDSAADPLASGAPGRQVLVSAKGVLSQVAVDPSGTSANPAIDPRTLDVVFESTADLATSTNMGARQVFLRRADGTL